MLGEIFVFLRFSFIGMVRRALRMGSVGMAVVSSLHAAFATAAWLGAEPRLTLPARNAYLHARLEVTPAYPIQHARLRVSARDRYTLYINGEVAHYGPARSWRPGASYDEMDLLPHLPAAGPVVLALTVHWLGVDTFQVMTSEQCAFFAAGELRGRDKTISLGATAGWRVQPAAAWAPDSARIGVQLGFQEWFDARREPTDWQWPGFDDRSWPRARVLPDLAPPAAPRAVPLLTRRLHPPVAVVAQGWAVEPTAPAAGDAAERLNATTLLPAAAGATAATFPLTLPPARHGRARYVLLDFGRVRLGRLVLNFADAVDGQRVEIGYGERLIAGRLYPRLPLDPAARATSCVALADRYTCRAGAQQWRSFSPRGFRYALLVVRGPLTIAGAAMEQEGQPWAPVGSLVTSDPLLNDCWQTGVHTLDACAHDALVDCPWREQAQWLGDALVSARNNAVVYGEPTLMRRLLRQAVEMQDADGFFPGVFPLRPPAGMLLTLPDYCLVWIVALHEHVWQSGDTALARELAPALERLLRGLHALRDQSGLIRHDPARHWLLIDSDGLPPARWDERYYSASLNLLYAWALEHAASLLTLGGDAAAAESAAAARRAVLQAVWAKFLDAESGRLYERADEHGVVHRAWLCRHPAALALLAAPDAPQRQAWLEQLTDPRAREVSVYFQTYALSALLRHGRVETALDIIRACWGPWLADGLTTWPEFWGDAPLGTHCHAWSGAPTFALSRALLGVAPLEPGGARVRIAPRTGGLRWVAGALPTPHGLLEVQWRRETNGLDLTLVIPDGVAAELPDGRRVAAGTHRLWLAGAPDVSW